MNEQLYNSTKDEQRKNNVPFVASFEPDFDFTLKRTITEPLAIIDFNSADGATEDDVLNRMNLPASESPSQLAQQQIAAQQAAVAEAQRIAAQRAAAEAQAIKDAEAVQAKIKQDAEIAFAKSIQEAANKQSAELAAAAEAERQRALADEQKAAELLVVQRSAPESIAPTPGNVAMSPDLSAEVGAVLSQGTSGEKAAEAAAADLSAQKYLAEATKEAAEQNIAVSEAASAGIASGTGTAYKSEEGKSDSEVVAKAKVVQAEVTKVIEEAKAEKDAANTAEEKKIAEAKLRDAQNVYNAATTIIENGGKSEDIFDMIAKWIIKNFNL